MASPQSLSLTSIPFLVLLLFLACLPSTTLSQNPGTSPSAPTIAECGTSLLPLASCAPFVQGTVASPAQTCCDNIKQLYNQQPGCLCLLLNDTSALSSFPINTTLALQLPLLCNLQVDNISTCSGVPSPPPSSPASQVSFGTETNSTLAASPPVTMLPRTTIMGYGFSCSEKLMMEGHLVVVVLAAVAAVTALLWTNVSH